MYPLFKTPEDEKLEELLNSASRMRGQFHQNSFTIMTDRSTATSTKREICNGIRVDYQHILTRKECCEKNIKVRVVKFLNCEVVVAVVTISQQNKVCTRDKIVREI